MLEIDDIEIKIKKYDRDKNIVILNLLICGQLEIRGYTVRFTETRYSRSKPIWLVTPPSTRTKRNVWFHVVRFKDTALWQQVREQIEQVVIDYTKNI